MDLQATMPRLRDEETDATDDGFVLYQAEFYTGEVVETGKTGAIIALSTYENGAENGPSRKWYESGRLQAEGEVDHGRAVGTWRMWHENGVLAREHTLDDTGRAISQREWDADGNITVDKIYSKII